MSYALHNFTDGDVIYASPLNDMDQQIQTNETNIAQKISKVNGATEGNFAAFDANGAVTDSGHSHSDYEGKADKAGTVLTTTLSRGRKEDTTVATASFAFGYNVEASGSYSHGEGYSTKASGGNSHAEGSDSKATGITSHAENYNTLASGIYSHAEGSSTTASGANCHSEGAQTIASGSASHAEGSNTRANHKSQHAGGEYNVSDSSSADSSERGTYVEIIGNGTANNARSNARALDWSGNERIAGDLYVGCNSDSSGGTKVAKETDFTGATSSTAGTHGLVPAPTSGSEGNFLRGDGTWVGIAELPAVTSSDNGKVLRVSNGAWAVELIPEASGNNF